MGNYDPVALECLTAVVEEGSFERAAKRQLVTQSAVSQRLSALEAQVGQPLVVRNRPIVPTAVGQLLLQHARKMRALRADLGQELRQQSAADGGALGYHDHLSIAVDADSLATWLPGALARVGSKGHLLEVLTDNACQTTQRLREGRVHGCISTDATPPPRCQSFALGYWDYIAVAQTQYAQRHCPGGLGLNNFRELPFFALNRHDDTASLLVAQALGLRQIRLHQHFVPDPQARLGLLLAGWGVGVMPRAMVIERIAQGALVDIAPQHAMQVHLYWHVLSVESEVFSHLSQAITSAATDYLSTDVPGPPLPYRQGVPLDSVCS